jgi:hypothetical protein
MWWTNARIFALGLVSGKKMSLIALAPIDYGSGAV